MPHIYLSLSLCLVILSGCERSVPDAPRSEFGRKVQMEMDTLRADYAAMELPATLARARRLAALLETRGDEVAASDRAEVYEYLAQLHFQHFLHVDSVHFYTARAEALVTDKSPDTLRARQLLCAAYDGWEDWTWLDMQLQARTGRYLLQRAGRQRTLAYAQLLTIEARATKKFGDGADSLDRPRIFAVSEARFREAVALLSELHSPWETYVREQLILVLTRDTARQHLIRPAVDTLRRLAAGFGLDHAFEERLLGYWHRHASRPDSGRHYYEKLLTKEPLWLGKRTSEARYALELYRSGEGDFDGAFQYAVDDLVRRSCCPPGIHPTHPDSVLQCDRRSSCIHFISSNSDLFRRKYTVSGDPADAERAFTYANHAVAGYERTFRQIDEQLVLNKNLVLGDRLIASALGVITGIGGRIHAEGTYHDAVFRAIELGKSILLTREIAAAGAAMNFGETGSIARELRARSAERKELQVRFSASFDLPPDDLLEFDRLSREIKALSARLATYQIEQVEAQGTSVRLPALDQVRAGLSGEQGLLEFAETGTTVYALYADRDTSVVYTLDRDTVRQYVMEFSAVLTDGPSYPVADYAERAFNLYRMLFGPLDSTHLARAELIVSPSESLQQLPFAALLPSGDHVGKAYSDLPYLIHRHRFRYVASWRAEQQYAGLRQRSLDPGKAVVGAWTHRELSGYLGGTAESLLQRTAPSGLHYSGQKCNSKTLLADAADYDWLHLAVHATSDPSRMNANYLLMGRQDTLDDTAIGQLILPARLVVLAACSTSRGMAHRWEGTYSLRRSFHRAGVPDVVASLHDIPAAATAGLLDAFYGHLLAGCDPSQALAYAQQACALGKLNNRWAWPGAWSGVVVG